MTTPDVPDASDLDELASALVDGEATEAEQARADEPEVAARVARFEAVARVVGTPVEPADDLARSRAIRAALAAARPAPAPARGMPTWLAPAAAVVVVLAGFGLFLAALAGGSSDDEESAGADAASEATVASETAGEGGGGGESFEESAGDVAGGTSAEAPMATTLADEDLGAFEAPPELADALRARLGSARPGTADDGAAQRSAELDARGCEGAFAASTVLDVLRATLNDRPVLVVVLEREDGRLSYAAVAEPTCETLAAGDL